MEAAHVMWDILAQTVKQFMEDLEVCTWARSCNWCFCSPTSYSHALHRQVHMPLSVLRNTSWLINRKCRGVMDNGMIPFAHMAHMALLIPRKKTAWNYTQPKTITWVTAGWSLQHNFSKNFNCVLVHLNSDMMNGCDLNNGGCEQICTSIRSIIECSCNDGYLLDADAASCRGYATYIYMCIITTIDISNANHLNSLRKTFSCNEIYPCHLTSIACLLLLTGFDVTPKDDNY